MKARSIVCGAILSVSLVAGGYMLAQTVPPPVVNINAQKHPDLAAAQKLIVEAWNKLSDAQKHSDWDMQHHAEKAKQLLDQASKELKLAAEAANQHK